MQNSVALGADAPVLYQHRTEKLLLRYVNVVPEAFASIALQLLQKALPESKGFSFRENAGIMFVYYEIVVVNFKGPRLNVLYSL